MLCGEMRVQRLLLPRRRGLLDASVPLQGARTGPSANLFLRRRLCPVHVTRPAQCRAPPTRHSSARPPCSTKGWSTMRTPAPAPKRAAAAPFLTAPGCASLAPHSFHTPSKDEKGGLSSSQQATMSARIAAADTSQARALNLPAGVQLRPRVGRSHPACPAEAGCDDERRGRGGCCAL